MVSEDDLRIASERLALAHQEGTEKARSEQDGHNRPLPMPIGDELTNVTYPPPFSP
jgi:hypothetical protein